MNERQYNPPLAELLDRLTIDRIKMLLKPEYKYIMKQEIEQISDDIEMLLGELDIENPTELIITVIILAQANVHIWYLKDKMQQEPDRYLEYLKFSHQLNGIRNHMKNRIMDIAGDKAKHTNFDIGGLEAEEF
ncbi:MAG: hypothetical protein PHQ43_01320 [Dehalococcoidales bacterium]|nr:hypothetical protein [Dehalococcoidales bacterium]